MADPRRAHERRGWAFGLCVAILEPLLVVLTKRRWRGGEHIPATGGCVLAVNHISHVDPITCAHFVLAQGRVVRFLTKSELFEVPVVGRIVRSAQQIPVYRMTSNASQSFDAAVEAVRAGQCVVVYPEGTLTREPDLWPMTGKTGAARIALAAEVPVVPIAQWGAHRILPPYTKRPLLLPRKTIEMTAGPPVPLEDLRARGMTPDALREATDRVMDEITRLLEGIRGESAPPVRYDPRTSGVRLTGNPHGPSRPAARRRRRS